MFTKHEADTLRQLAQRVHDIAILPEQDDKRALWRRHTALKGERPMVFVHPDGAWSELLPADSLTCETPFAREIEYDLRSRLIRAQYLPDDVPVEGGLPVKRMG